MSKYENLCHAYAAARKDFFENREGCRQIAEQLVTGLAAHLGCEPDQLRYVRFSARGGDRTDQTLDEVLSLGAGDIWNFGVRLMLHETPGATPSEAFLIGISLEPVTGGYVLYARGVPEKYRLLKSGDNSHVMSTFYENLYRRIRDSYKNPKLRFSSREQTERALGA